MPESSRPRLRYKQSCRPSRTGCFVSDLHYPLFSHLLPRHQAHSRDISSQGKLSSPYYNMVVQCRLIHPSCICCTGKQEPPLCKIFGAHLSSLAPPFLFAVVPVNRAHKTFAHSAYKRSSRSRLPIFFGFGGSSPRSAAIAVGLRLCCPTACTSVHHPAANWSVAPVHL